MLRGYNCMALGLALTGLVAIAPRGATFLDRLIPDDGLIGGEIASIVNPPRPLPGSAV